MAMIKTLFFIIITALLFSSCELKNENKKWYEGNLHTHTLWNDGDAPPEIVVSWYKERNYNFLALSNHNILSVNEKQVKVYDDATSEWPPTLTKDRLIALQEHFGYDWPVTRTVNGSLEMALMTLPELKAKFEKPEEFILIQAEEITDNYEGNPIHVNATNLIEMIPPQSGDSNLKVLEKNIDAVKKQSEETGQAMMAHINHLNFGGFNPGWGITAEDLLPLNGINFFEIYNGSPLARNWGDDTRPGTDRLWDIILAFRLQQGLEPFFGLAVDDAHEYYEYKVGKSNPGRGWIMVKAKSLNADNIIAALKLGNFYATTGVLLEDIITTDHSLSIHVQTEDNIIYLTQFIGTPKNFNAASKSATTESIEPVRITDIYSEEIGQVFYETTENPAIYHFSGNEMYIRAKIISSHK